MPTSELLMFLYVGTRRYGKTETYSCILIFAVAGISAMLFVHRSYLPSKEIRVRQPIVHFSFTPGSELE